VREERDISQLTIIPVAGHRTNERESDERRVPDEDAANDQSRTKEVGLFKRRESSRESGSRAIIVD